MATGTLNKTGSFLFKATRVGKDTALAQSVTPTEDYLLGIPLLADYLEEGLNQMGVYVSSGSASVSSKVGTRIVHHVGCVRR